MCFVDNRSACGSLISNISRCVFWVSQESQAVPLENVARVLGEGSPGRAHRRHSHTGEEAIPEKLEHGNIEKQSDTG